MLDAYHSPGVVQTAVDLANTLRPIKGEDALETLEQLRDFLDDHPAAEPASPAAKQGTGPRHLTRADLAEVRALRETVRKVLERANTDAAEAAALIN
ncbi:ABATE domain-containing protein, partial [Streptomyces sp. 7R007]